MSAPSTQHFWGAAAYSEARLGYAAKALRALAEEAFARVLDAKAPPPRLRAGDAKALRFWLLPVRWRKVREWYLRRLLERPLPLTKASLGKFSGIDFLMMEMRPRSLLGRALAYPGALAGGPPGLENAAAMLESLAFGHPDFQMKVAARLRKYLARRVLFYPEPPPAVPFSPRVWWLIIAACLPESGFLDWSGRRLAARLAELGRDRAATGLRVWDEWLVLEAVQTAPETGVGQLGPLVQRLQLLPHERYEPLRLKMEAIARGKVPGAGRKPARPEPSQAAAVPMPPMPPVLRALMAGKLVAEEL